MTGGAPSPDVPTGAARFEAFRRVPAAHGVLLALFSLFTALILALSDELTSGAIADRATEDLYASLAQVIPDDLHENDLTADILTLADATQGVVQVYVARQGDTVTAAAYVMTGQGYSGAIRVLLGVTPTGELLGVRVLAHSETPGLGDRIEVGKSDWIKQFAGLSLGDPGTGGWKVQRDGGVFDQFSGATITPRAVVGAVHHGLEFFAQHRDAILAPAPHEKESG